MTTVTQGYVYSQLWLFLATFLCQHNLPLLTRNYLSAEQRTLPPLTLSASGPPHSFGLASISKPEMIIFQSAGL